MVRRPTPRPEVLPSWEKTRHQLNVILLHLGIVETSCPDAEKRRHDQTEEVQQCLQQRLMLYYWVKTVSDFGTSTHASATDAVIASINDLSPRERLVLEAIVEAKATVFRQYIMEQRHNYV